MKHRLRHLLYLFAKLGKKIHDFSHKLSIKKFDFNFSPLPYSHQSVHGLIQPD
jgi:hypothetical protein